MLCHLLVLVPLNCRQRPALGLWYHFLRKFLGAKPLVFSCLAEFDQLFKLNINRNHRGFRRVIQSKGIKFEIFHKGSFFRSDKLVGTAHLKLERLENECEIREILEVVDGRKPTGGKLEVKVRLREPLSGQDVQMVTENWLVLEPRGL